MSEEYIIGRNPVLEALRSERDINKIWIAEGSQKGSMQPLIGLAKEKKVFVQIVPKKRSTKWQKASIKALSHKWSHMNMWSWMTYSQKRLNGTKHLFHDP